MTQAGLSGSPGVMNVSFPMAAEQFFIRKVVPLAKKAFTSFPGAAP